MMLILASFVLLINFYDFIASTVCEFGIISFNDAELMAIVKDVSFIYV